MADADPPAPTSAKTSANIAAPVTQEPAPQPTAPPATSAKRPAKKPKPKIVKVEKPKLPPIEERKYLLEYFPSLWLGEKVYDWQFDCLRDLGFRNSRVALKAANGSGKTSKVVAAAIAWHMVMFPGSQTVVTAGVYRQVTEVLWPVLRTITGKLGGEAMGWQVTENRILYTAPGQTDPAMCVGFSASDPHKAEGWHGRGASGNLMYVIDEAKGVSDAIFMAMERCQPTRLLVVSSPGGCAGEFYEIFRRGDDRYDRYSVTAQMCPHIGKDWIAEQINRYGEKSVIVQSMIFAEFGVEGSDLLILNPMVLQRNISSPPAKTGTMLKAGCDFAAGGDENVIQVIEGNTHKETIKWREKDTMAAVGRFVTEFKRLGLQASNIYADAGGMGIPMCDALREAGWTVNRVNNGEAARDGDRFANRGTEMWVQFARMVETGRVALPNDELTHRQLTTRHLLHNSKGKLIAESKDDMRKRGLDSPDRADALVLAFCGGSASFEAYLQNAGRSVNFSALDEENEDSGNAVHTGYWAG